VPQPRSALALFVPRLRAEANYKTSSNITSWSVHQEWSVSVPLDLGLLFETCSAAVAFEAKVTGDHPMEAGLTRHKVIVTDNLRKALLQLNHAMARDGKKSTKK
jgi:hypothetical protein